ncbi:nickel pincer cofactor biosynthesis protein LarC [Desulfatiglans anilini]|uniref:nickel pincer cofactor biosynthesis protein LarC n=1 Tax=Desulfatiglans anilini TaxID=90728 RepID=UPI000424D077|nr:nickel pincer cofactor biosynthesis protein LarC [Desulfatiglans anilini]
MKTAYFDCYAGVSGDMFIGSLLDAGLPFEELQAALETLPLEGYRLAMREERRQGIRGTRFLVEMLQHEHAHRRLGDVRRIIHSSALSDWAKGAAEAVFEILARAEGKVHGLSPDAVTFHEVGAVDSIVDIVGGVFGVESLGIESIQASPLPLGRGFTSSAHGRLPLPAPATLEILAGLEVRDAGTETETVTPTGAALLKALASSWGPMPAMRIQRIGYGAGSRDLPDRPNCLRVLIGDAAVAGDAETVLMLETNLDDASPEFMGYMMERLFGAGALDVVFFPVQMKKNRPGTQVQVMAHPVRKDDLTRILFEESLTLGVRVRMCEREVLERDLVTVESPWGPLQVKRVKDPGGRRRLVPEYEACRAVAVSRRVPLRDVYAWVTGLGDSGL